MAISCDCQRAKSPLPPPFPTSVDMEQQEQPACEGPLDLLTITNEVVGVEGGGAHIWRFRARASNSDSTVWRLQGNVGVFEKLQTTVPLSTYASTAFKIPGQGCFFAFLTRNMSGTSHAEADKDSSGEHQSSDEWMRRGGKGAMVHVWRYEGGPRPVPCTLGTDRNGTDDECAFKLVQQIGKPLMPNARNFSAAQAHILGHVVGRSAPQQLSRGPFDCSMQSLGCIVGAQALHYVQAGGEHYLAIAQTICARGEAQDSCDAQSLRGTLETRSAILEWDSVSQQFDELQSLSSATRRNLYDGRNEDRSPEHLRHSYPLRIPAGRAVSIASFYSAVEGRHTRTVLVISSLTAGAVLYDLDIPVLEGLNGSSAVLSAIVGATYSAPYQPSVTRVDSSSPGSKGPGAMYTKDVVRQWYSTPRVHAAHLAENASQFVYVLSNVDRALTVFERRPVLDVFGNPRGHLALIKTIWHPPSAPSRSSHVPEALEGGAQGVARGSMLDLRGASALRFFMRPSIRNNETHGGLAIPLQPTIAAQTRAAPGEQLCGRFAVTPCESLEMIVQQIDGPAGLFKHPPRITPNGSLVMEGALHKIGTATFRVVAQDSTSVEDSKMVHQPWHTQTPGPGVSEPQVFSITLAPVNTQPDFEVRNVVAQENMASQALIFAVNATPGATRRASLLVGSTLRSAHAYVFALLRRCCNSRCTGVTDINACTQDSFGENSSGTFFELRQTSCFIQRMWDTSAWDNMTSSDMIAAYFDPIQSHENGDFDSTAGPPSKNINDTFWHYDDDFNFVFDGPYAPCGTQHARDGVTSGQLFKWKAGDLLEWQDRDTEQGLPYGTESLAWPHEATQFVYFEEGMAGAINVEPAADAIGFAGFEAVLIDSEGSSNVTGAPSTSSQR